MTANMSDLTQIKDTEGQTKPKKEGQTKANKEGQNKLKKEGQTKTNKEGQNKRYTTKTTPEEIIAKHKEEQELEKANYKAEMQAYLKERLKQGKNKVKLEHAIKQLEAKIKAA